jgi:hypothetical protein
VAAPQVVVESGPDPGKFGHKVTCQLTGGEVGMISDGEPESLRSGS